MERPTEWVGKPNCRPRSYADWHIGREFRLSPRIQRSAISDGQKHEGQNTRAVEAIAQAKGKIASGDKVGASGEAAGLQSQARAALASAEALLSKGKKEKAIAAAQNAGEFADPAIVSANQNKAAANNGSCLMPRLRPLQPHNRPPVPMSAQIQLNSQRLPQTLKQMPSATLRRRPSLRPPLSLRWKR